ncbi:hypothetical protein BKA93DRAFT_710792, partial [Sparassis latifolia]
SKAQARHRVKRKAYLENLESTVIKLQSMLSLSSDEVVALPTALLRLRELQIENGDLRNELREIRQ